MEGTGEWSPALDTGCFTKGDSVKMPGRREPEHPGEAEEDEVKKGKGKCHLTQDDKLGF